jgi:hypothetical protein
MLVLLAKQKISLSKYPALRAIYNQQEAGDGLGKRPEMGGLGTWLYVADFRILILMNRKCTLAHPMIVDVDLKEGFPDGWA